MNPAFNIEPDLILIFGDRPILEDAEIVAKLTDRYPKAVLAGCSSAGHMLGSEVHDQTVTLTAIRFFFSQAVRHSVRLTERHHDSYAAGRYLISKFSTDKLRHLLVFSDGLEINGSDLIDGITSSLPEGITVSGGLAGDGEHFNRTLVLNDRDVFSSATVTAIGLYGDRLEISSGAAGGWVPFGMPRTVTSSTGNIVHGIDNRPALDVYKQFLGPLADNLPASGLLVPISFELSGEPIIRTILGVDETKKTLRFAGDVPEGVAIRFMKAGADELIAGAEEAAKLAGNKQTHRPDLVLMISCVGRKLVLRQMVEEEIEAVLDAMRRPINTGFYSYGELGPLPAAGGCRLLNQSMTVTTIREH